MLILTILQGPDKGRLFELPDTEPQMIGRSVESLPLSDQTISRRHAALTPDDGRWYIVDLESANGTFVNGRKVEGRKRLEPGDQIRAGCTLFVFGMDSKTVRRRGVQMLQPDVIDAVVERTAKSQDSVTMVRQSRLNPFAVLDLTVQLTQVTGTVTDKQELLENVMNLVFDAFDADRGFVLLQGESDEPADPIVVKHRLAPEGEPHPPIAVSRTIVQHVLKRNEGVLSKNAMSDERFASGESVQDLAIRSAICVPIRYKEKTFGVIHVDSQIASYTFTDEQLQLLTAVGIHTGLAMNNADLIQQRLMQERLAAVGQTVASLSHSVKNILQGMRGGAEVVEMGLKKQNLSVVGGGWEIVSRNLERIYELTMNMLTFSKNRKPELELVNIVPLIEETVAMVQKQFDARGVALITDFESDLPPIGVDPSGLHQALLNLLNNALDAVEDNTGAVTLQVTFEDAPSFTHIRVRDNGPGIEPERMKRLFQPFQSTKGLKGTGLGLVVTKKIAEEHGGKVSVDSQVGHGATFTLTLPMNTGDGKVESEDTLAPQGATSSDTTNDTSLAG